MNLYVGNPPYKIPESDLQGLFTTFGEVPSIKIIQEGYTRQSNGFGFVEIQDNTQGQAAMKESNGKPFQGRTIIVNEAHPQKTRAGGRNSRCS